MTPSMLALTASPVPVTADTRAALVDYRANRAASAIATGAEGINLQFCSMVINYDLLWNPQRIEQRIRRCHRYGQKRRCCRQLLNRGQRRRPARS